MATDYLDTTKLAAMVRSKRGDTGLRDTAAGLEKIVGKISPATLSRIEQGKAPDVETFLRICRWLGVDASEFSTGGKLPTSSSMKRETLEVIEAHLRADKSLSADTTNTLVEMIRLVYRQASQKE